MANATSSPANGHSKKPALPTEGAPNNFFNLDIERQVLGSMLLDNDVIVEVQEHVSAADFYLPAHQAIFKAICDIAATSSPVDLSLLVDQLRQRKQIDEVGGYVALAALEQLVVSTGAAPEQAAKVADKSRRRKLALFANELKTMAHDAETSDQALDHALTSLLRMSDGSAGSGFIDAETWMAKTLESIEYRRQNQGATGLRFGIPEVDQLTGGLEPDAFMILAARPSVGKTAFALQIVQDVGLRQAKPVALFSVEMGHEMLGLRTLAAKTHLSLETLRGGSIAEQKMRDVRHAASQMALANIHIDDTPGISLAKVVSRATRLKARIPDLALIVVDYLQLLSPEAKRGGGNRNDEVRQISWGLCVLAKTLQVPVLSLSQLSRSCEKEGRPPRLSDLRDSGAIEQDATDVGFLHRPDKKSMDTDFLLEKSRNGRTGKALLRFDGQRQTFAGRA